MYDEMPIVVNKEATVGRKWNEIEKRKGIPRKQNEGYLFDYKNIYKSQYIIF